MSSIDGATVASARVVTGSVMVLGVLLKSSIKIVGVLVAKEIVVVVVVVVLIGTRVVWMGTIVASVEAVSVFVMPGVPTPL